MVIDSVPQHQKPEKPEESTTIIVLVIMSEEDIPMNEGEDDLTISPSSSESLQPKTKTK